MSYKLTPIISNTFTPLPDRPGVYQRVRHTGNHVYARWDGKHWHCGRWDRRQAAAVEAVSDCQATEVLESGRVKRPAYYVGWRGIVKAGFTAVAAVALAGCADTRIFENRLMCNLDGSGGVIVSRYGGVGIASNIADEDIRRVCAAAKPGVSQ